MKGSRSWTSEVKVKVSDLNEKVLYAFCVSKNKTGQRINMVGPIVKYSYANNEDLLIVTEKKEENYVESLVVECSEIYKIIAHYLSSQCVYTYFVTSNSPWIVGGAC